MVRAMPRASPSSLPKEAAAVHHPGRSRTSSSILLSWPREELEDLAADTQWTSAKINQIGCLQHCPIP